MSLVGSPSSLDGRCKRSTCLSWRLDYPPDHRLPRSRLSYTREPRWIVTTSCARPTIRRRTAAPGARDETWNVGRVITDANRSASKWRTREREGFEEALHLIASKKYDAFVTWEPSRAGRELLAYVQLRAACQEAGVLYLTKGRVYDFSRHDDSFMMGLEFLTAEKDAAVIRDRRLRTVRLNAQKGRPHGRLPYGYRRVYDEQTRALVRQEIDPGKASIIITAVDEILDGVSINNIVTRLNRAGVPTPMKPTSDQSRGWMSSTLRQLIKSPTIAGLRMYQGEVIGEADWPAIVPVEKWEKVNQILADRARRTRYVEEGNHSHPRWAAVIHCQVRLLFAPLGAHSWCRGSQADWDASRQLHLRESGVPEGQYRHSLHGRLRHRRTTWLAVQA
ncbi:recombinase family protein [Brachybacterium sp. GPGPB12]|uniref:recombinase family protein n=1 Tax=Brachybacterium sp. GPGPB12 TaxID=3023517 RepID=UPI003134428B